MKLFVTGQSVVDIISYKGKQEIKPGGIHYSALGLTCFVEDQDEIYLCTSLSKKNESLFEKTYSLLNDKYIRYVDEMPTVNLTIHEDKERDETYSNISQNLLLPFDDLNSFDGIFINMVTGYDITLDQLKNIRQNYNGLIYFDVHTFSRDVDENMKRNFRRIPKFESWAGNIDILQANQKEMLTLSDQKEEFNIVEEMINYGISIVIITKGEYGVRTYFKNKNEIESIFLPALNTNAVNKVGCGDVFGAVFFYNYISQRNVYHSLMLANTAAGISTEYSEIADFKNFKKDVFKRFGEE